MVSCYRRREIVAGCGKNPSTLSDGLRFHVVKQVNNFTPGKRLQENAFHHPDVVAPAPKVREDNNDAVHRLMRTERRRRRKKQLKKKYYLSVLKKRKKMKRRETLFWLCAGAFFAEAWCNEFTLEEIDAFCNLTYSVCEDDCKSPCQNLTCGEECDSENNIVRLILSSSNLTDIPRSIELFPEIAEL